MTDRMTSAEARIAAKRFRTDFPLIAPAWTRAADALAHYEAEAERLAGMPTEVVGWAVVNNSGAIAASSCDSAAHARAIADRFNRNPDFSTGPFRVCRLVAESGPMQEVQPSGFWYRRTNYDDGSPVVEMMDGETRCVGVSGSGLWCIPPADRALVARLLGEG